MPTTSQASTWQALEQRAQELGRRRLALQVGRESNEKTRQKLLDQALAAQARLDAGDSVKGVLEAIQRQSHERAVGAYEQMLSALLADVLPGQRDVVLDLHAERGAPAMDVFIRKGDDAPLEDAWLGTGGSVTNLLSTGLRLVALMRSGRRRFLVLDESDCWIKPSLVERYASVVAQMARELGVQVLMVSHHDESLFAQHIPYRLRMSRVGSTTTTEWSAGSEVPNWDVSEDGMRSIGLFDFQAHKNTVVPLAPGVTLLQGDNDIGKSAVVNALRAIFDGVSNDTMIRHHASKARVEIDLGHQLLTWSRNRKGAVKVSYDLIDSQSRETLHASTGTKVPEWLTEEIGIGKVDDLDVQIGQQQEPVFLLNQPASKRAKALAVGQESGHIQAMMILDRQELQAAKGTLRQCEDEIERLRQFEVATRAIEQAAAPDTKTIMDARERKERGEQLRLLAGTWSRAARIVGAGSLVTPPPQAPRLHGLRDRLLLDRWEGAKRQEENRRSVRALVLNSPPLLNGKESRLALNRWKSLDREKQPREGLRGQGAPEPGRAPRAGEYRRLLSRWKRLDGEKQPMEDLREQAAPEPARAPRAGENRRLAERWQWAARQAHPRHTLRKQNAPIAPRQEVRHGHGVLMKWHSQQAKRAVLLPLLTTASPKLPTPSHGQEARKQLDAWRAATQNAMLQSQALNGAWGDERQAEQAIQAQFPRCPTCGHDLVEHEHAPLPT